MLIRGLDVVVEIELVGVGAKGNGVALVNELEVNVGIDHVFGEDIASGEELVVGLERGESFSEIAWGLFDICFLFWREFVEVLVYWLWWLDSILDSIEACH